MTTVQVETSPFAMFPAQGDCSNTDHEKREALRALLPVGQQHGRTPHPR